MYSHIWTDPDTSASASTTHTSVALTLLEYRAFAIYVSASSVPGGTRLYLEGSATEATPTEGQWEPLWEGNMQSGENYLVEKTTAISWIRYRITVGSGSDLTGLVGNLVRKGW